MSESQFGAPPKNGKRALLKHGNPLPTPFHVEVWVEGKLMSTTKFADIDEAKRFQRGELLR